MDLPTLPWTMPMGNMTLEYAPRHRGQRPHSERVRPYKPRHCACCVDSGMHLFRRDRRG